MEHTRANFLKSLLLGATSIPVLIEACSKNSGNGSSENSSSSSSDSSSTSTSSTSTTGCIATPAETAGPYPYDLSSDSAIYRTDITEGKTGIPLSLTLTVVNSNADCAVLSNARVDIWHCDKDGYYSEYSEPGYLGTEDNAGKTFLRGIQLTDSNGQVRFTTIYPGWYAGRVTHIHLEIFVSSVLKLTTQLCFPDSLNTTVYQTALYSAHGENTTTNSTDQVFSDGYSTELVSISGDTTNGYTATFKVGVPI
ncbi:MAG TPA: intradiol ring-cleavage dioxygenase [Puia sp.]|nr:intradiol ring-cleavage dioxygenase [Puia sp.]